MQYGGATLIQPTGATGVCWTSRRVGKSHRILKINKPPLPTPHHCPGAMSSSTTPQAGGSTKRSYSGGRRPLSRPTTPLRPSSRSSLRESGKASIGGASDAPLEAFEPAFAELSDSMADLEANFMHLQLMHESLARFSESFASFLYGLNMNAFCVDFPEVSGKWI